MKRFVAKKKKQARERLALEQIEDRADDPLYQKIKLVEDLRGRKPARPSDPAKVMEIGLYRAMEPALFDREKIRAMDNRK